MDIDQTPGLPAQLSRFKGTEEPRTTFQIAEHIDYPGPFRLVGLVAYDLVEIDSHMQFDLFGTLVPRRRLDFAIDGLADRYGIDVVYRADAPPSGMRLAPTLDFLDDRTFD